MTNEITVSTQVLSLYVESRKSLKLAELNRYDQNAFMVEITTKLALSHGVAVEHNDLIFLCSEMLRAIAEEFPHIRKDEIRHAFQLSGSGKFGPVYNKLSLSQVMTFLRQYLESEDRENALRLAAQQKTRLPELPKAPPSPAQILEMSIEALLSDYRLWLSGKPIINAGSCVYDFLDQLGFVTLSPQQKHEAIDLKKQFMISNLELTRKLSPREDRHSIDREISAIIEGQTSVIAAVKTDIVKHIFSDFQNLFENREEEIKSFLQDRANSVTPQ